MAATKHSLRLSILGAGAWGTTLALIADRAGTNVTLIAHRPELADHLRTHRQHPRSLPDIDIPARIAISNDAEKAIADSDVVIFAVPTQSLRRGIVPLAHVLNGKILVSAVKGLELETYLRASAIITEVVGDTRIYALSGPNLSLEIAKGQPATAVIAGKDQAALTQVQRALMSDTFRIYLSEDIIGVEMGGALKNIIAIGAGIGDGLNAGDNAKAAFITRGIAEIARLGVACGADILTFAGLSGIGDLIATCSSPLSRNHQVGRGLAAGKSVEQVLATMSEVAEGIATTKAAYDLGRQLGVELPITEQMYGVLYEGVSPLAAVASLMAREPKYELGGIVDQDASRSIN